MTRNRLNQVLRGATRAGALAAIAACADNASMMAPELSPSAAPSLARTTTEPLADLAGVSSYPLYAGGGGDGKGTLAGYLRVTSASAGGESRTFSVTYDAEPGFCFSEAHLNITGGDPQSMGGKNGNPAPGQFPYKSTPGGCVDQISFNTGPIALGGGDNNAFAIAAHAVSQQTGTPGYAGGSVVSTPGSVTLTGRRDGNVSGFTDLSLPAVAAWEPDEVGGTSFWDTQIAGDPDGVWLALNGADFLWETFRTNERRLAGGGTQAAQSNTINGSVVRMVTTISPTAATTGTLRITCDNGYRVELTNANGTTVVAGGDGALAAFLTQLSNSMSNGVATWTDLRQDHVSYDGWQTVESYPVSLASGLNTFTIFGVNEYMQTDDRRTTPANGEFNPTGNEILNPAGCIFGVQAAAVPGVPSGGSETAWGANASFGGTYDEPGNFSGSNWATFIFYRVKQ